MNDRFPIGKVVLTGLALIVGFFVLLIIGSLIATGTLFFQAEVKEAQRPAREKLIVQDASSALQKYEEFYDNCNDTIRLTRQIEDAEREFKEQEKLYERTKENDSFGQGAQNLSRIREDAQGLRDQRELVVKDYNSSSAKAKTRSLFKANDLPYRLDPPYEQINCGGSS